nr:pilus assembly protein CpaE [uncultured Sphingomonas sp.]
MTMYSSDRPNAQWHADAGTAPVRLLLTGVEGQASELVGATAAGFPLDLVIVDLANPIDPAILDGAAAAVVQVASDNPISIERFKRLATGPVPLIAASFDPSLALVRELVRAGAHDVVPLPLAISELETALDPIRRLNQSAGARARADRQRIVTIIKSEGGVGATALLSQAATRFAAGEVARGRQACLLDLDLQFGDSAFQLGLQPKLTFADLLEAGKRLDGELIRSVASPHPSGLQVVAAPREIMPLESMSSDQLMSVVDAAATEFGTLFIDLPMNWTNWSLSLLARSDLVLMVTELRVPSLNRARRQLDLLDSQGMHNLDVRVIVNRVEKGLFKNISTADAERVLHRPVSFTICNEHELMSKAIDHGVPVEAIKRKSLLGKDLAALDQGLASALGLEH